MGKYHADINELQPRSFQEEAIRKRASFERDVIAGMETAECMLTDVADALDKYPGYSVDAKCVRDEVDRIENLRLELSGFDSAA